jgi:ATP-dependent RNA helicase DeaD
MPSFNDMTLQPATRVVLANMGITDPSPIQFEAIPALLAGNDLIGQSATGSGKTLAYSIPLVERLSKERVAQALVLVPTRELAVQVNTVLSKLAASRRLTTALLVGGRPYANQISSLRYGAQIVVGTPGRIKDHIERGSLVLNQIRICVLDEADQMLDIGFAPIIEEILSTMPETKQMALFSATMPDWIAKLQAKFLKNPVKVDITIATAGESTIEQIAYQVPHDQKMAALCTLLHSTQGESSLIFGKTKYGVEKLGKQLGRLGFAVGTLHGDKSQRARDEILTKFRNGQVHTLLATNVAARGLDIKGIYQVINYELPESSDLFTHRIGRTGRMGQEGKAITLLVPSDLPKWRRMANNLGQAVKLQRLIIDEEALLARQEAPGIPERESIEEQRPNRGRRDFSGGQDREQRPFRNRREFSGGQDREPSNEQRPMRSSREFSGGQDREPSNEQRPIRSTREFSGGQDSEPSNEQRPVRARREFSPKQDGGRFERSKRDSYPAVDTRRRSDTNDSVAPARPFVRPSEDGGAPERSHAGRLRDGSRRPAGRPSNFSRSSAGRQKAYSFAETESQARSTTKRPPKAAQAGRPRRAAVSNHSTSR